MQSGNFVISGTPEKTVMFIRTCFFPIRVDGQSEFTIRHSSAFQYSVELVQNHHQEMFHHWNVSSWNGKKYMIKNLAGTIIAMLLFLSARSV